MTTPEPGATFEGPFAIQFTGGPYDSRREGNGHPSRRQLRLTT